MSVIPFTALACPIDGDPLTQAGASWRCPAGHNYDVARQGYLHLLPVQKKRSRDPGDSKEMVAARRRFLGGGHYQPIADAVSRLTLSDVPEEHATLNCLDAGCGEGYYLRELARAAEDRCELALVGLDISKWATLAAAKQDKRPRWVVGSNAGLPVLSDSLDRVLCLFGFPVYGEFSRVLKPGGVLVQADAGPDHLRELREIVYETVKPDAAAEQPVPEGFTRAGTDVVRYQLTLEQNEAIRDLLAMTPHFYRATAERRNEAEQLTALSVTIDVRLTCFVREPLLENRQSDLPL
ncbi:putative RNA methyltransferase [Marinobacter sp. HL-58]|uniref:putative RNA methyltransferase n=1 Tax=Marinobacter sp. HL-58 TaxID=1479237 RepID=UPI00048610BD|nr:methyltransferase domain-containing protein [Marinobacter sp. HL-58]KPP96875.1 MAG: 23S rRNA (guanine745-N1)-methyltransferase RlmA1 [Marinobacter sp. HL-58]